jgi:hypothetical protein
MATLKFHTTAHFLQRLSERQLSLENVKNVVRYPLRKKIMWRGNLGGWVHQFEKDVDQTTLVIVGEIKGSDCWLLTAYEKT